MSRWNCDVRTALKEHCVERACGMRIYISPCILSDAEPRMALVGSYPVELHLKSLYFLRYIKCCFDAVTTQSSFLPLHISAVLTLCTSA
jgi:hypothetical protein